MRFQRVGRHTGVVAPDLVQQDIARYRGKYREGWDVLRAVKDSRPATPVLVLTGWGDTTEVPSGARPDGVRRPERGAWPPL